MSDQPIKGFPLSDDYGATRVPNAILGRVLAEVEDPKTLKLILRAIWLLERQRGFPRYISTEDLRRDRVLSQFDQRRYGTCRMRKRRRKLTASLIGKYP